MLLTYVDSLWYIIDCRLVPITYSFFIFVIIIHLSIYSIRDLSDAYLTMSNAGYMDRDPRVNLFNLQSALLYPLI